MNNIKMPIKIASQMAPPPLKWDADEELETYAKVYLAGAGGGGKTVTAILMAKALVSDESKIAVINTEGASGAKIYKRKFPGLKIVTIEKPYHPQQFIDAIKMASELQMEAIIVDSGSHEWDGVLYLVNNSTVANDLAKWKIPGKLHDEFLEAIKSVPMHTFVTVRTKTKHYPTKGQDGRPTILKRPGSQLQRTGFDYEFDLGLVMTDGGIATVDKTHYDTLPMGMTFNKEPEKISGLISQFLYGE